MDDTLSKPCGAANPFGAMANFDLLLARRTYDILGLLA